MALVIQPFPDFHSGDEAPDVTDGEWKMFVGYHNLRDKIARAKDTKGGRITISEAMALVDEHEDQAGDLPSLGYEARPGCTSLQDLLNLYREEANHG